MTQEILEFPTIRDPRVKPEDDKESQAGGGGDDIVGNFKIPRINSRNPRAKN